MHPKSNPMGQIFQVPVRINEIKVRQNLWSTKFIFPGCLVPKWIRKMHWFACWNWKGLRRCISNIIYLPSYARKLLAHRSNIVCEVLLACIMIELSLFCVHFVIYEINALVFNDGIRSWSFILKQLFVWGCKTILVWYYMVHLDKKYTL